MITFLLYLLICGALCLLSVKFMSFINEKDNKEYWKTHRLSNFPFKWYGKTLWYSRACATVLFVFCKNPTDEWCVLANKRGKGTPDFQGFWNCVCGYLEHDIDGEDNCLKELKEECGITIPKGLIKLCNVNTDPNDNKQNVTIRYSAKIDDKLTTDFIFNTDEMEENEVEDIQWIPLSKIDDYKWAFNHENIIKEIANMVF